MIEKREHGWRTQKSENSLIRSSYSELDTLMFSGDGISISIKPSDDDVSQVLAAVSALESQGLSPKGCYNCLMFSQSGAQMDGGSTLGYCLNGKLGQHVNVGDMTTMTDSCERQELASPAEQQKKAETWRQSLVVIISE